MDSLLRCARMFAMLACAGSLYAQVTPLPAGTRSPDAGSDQAAAPASGATRAAALIATAENAIVRGDYAMALPPLNAAIAAAPASSTESARAFYDRGYVEQAQHQSPAAEADFRRASVADPKQFEAPAALGDLLAQQGKWKAARQELELARTLQPASGDRAVAVANVERTLARVDAQLHDPAAASDALLAALKSTPEQSDDTFLAAQLAEDQRNYVGAEQEYRKALAADPKSTAAAEGLARALIHQGKFAAAAPLLQTALQQQPNDPVLLAESATALAGEGKTQEAIAQLETLHQQNPGQPAVTRMLADLLSSGGDAAGAGPLYAQLLAGSPHDPDLLTAAAENLLREQKWNEAVQMFQQSLNLQPEQEDGWSGLAFAASQDRQYPLVLSALDHRALTLPESAATLFLRATALDHLHRTREAVVYYRRFLSEAQGKFPEEESETRKRLGELRATH